MDYSIPDEIWEDDIPSEPFRALGISLLGPAPIGTIHLQWRPELTVLYGLNGAGKSAVLRGIADVLTGRYAQGGAGFLHLAVNDPATEMNPVWWEGTHPTDFIVGIGDWVREKVGDALGPGSLDGVPLEDVWPRAREVIHTETIVQDVQRALDLLKGSDPEFHTVSTEIAPHAIFTLQAVGNDTTSYKIFAAGVPSPATPALNHHIASLRDRLAHADELEGQDDDFEASTDLYLRQFREFLDPQRPEWVPVPLVEIGHLQRSVATVYVGDRGQADRATHALLRTLARAFPGILTTSTTSQPDDSPHQPSLHKLTSLLSRAATQRLDKLLINAPALSLDPLPAHEWTEGRFARWMALDPPSLEMVPLDALSSAQSRWASTAIELALRELHAPDFDLRTQSLPSAIAIDEPEQALHGAAIPHLLNGLAILAAQTRSPVFVASHAAAFLDHHLAHPVFADRASGRTKIRPLPAPTSGTLQSAMEELGLRPSDLLQLTSTYLVVEGDRDVAVLQTLISEDLARLRTRMVSMDGTHNLPSVIDSQFIFDYTSASVIICLDRIRADRVEVVFAEANELLQAGPPRSARNRFDKALNERGWSPEELAAFRFGRRAVETRKLDRVRVFGLSEPDIIYYLPVEYFVPGERSWQPVQQRYRDTRRDGQKMYEWLRETRTAKKTNAEGFAEAATLLESNRPQEFLDLLDFIETMALRPRTTIT